MGVAPSSAGAFVGESKVIDSVTGKLTGPAETVITNPTFLPNEPTVPPGTAVTKQSPKSLLERVMTGSRLLPIMGKVLPWVGGAALSYEVCNAFISAGCFLFSSDEADPEPVAKWFLTLKPAGQVEVCRGDFASCNTYFIAQPHYTGQTFVYTETSHESCGVASPIPAPDIMYTAPAETCAGGNTGHRALPVRLSSTNRSITATTDTEAANYTGSGYCPASTFTGCSSEPNPNWSEDLATKLQEGDSQLGITQAEANELGEHIAAQIEGSEVADPYATYVSVPECAGEAWIGCKETLEELELVPERVELDWQTADIELGPDVVTELQPAPQTELKTGTKVTVTTNPNEAGMPLIVPSPEPGETYDDYAARLSPGLNPERVTVSPEFADPTVGPDGVIRTSPKAGTRTNPATETEVNVHTNPADAPVPPGGTWSAPAIPAINMDPLTEVSIGCNDFPFGIFCWLGDGLTSWGSSGSCPDVDVPLGTSAGVESGLPFDFCQFEPAMEIIRPILVLIASLTMAYMFAAAAMGFGGKGDED